MRITRFGVLGLAAVFIFGGSSSLPFVAADPPDQLPSPTSPVTSGISRSVVPQPADRHAETIVLTVVCETPDGKPIVGADVTCFEIDTWTGHSRVKTTLKTDATGTCRFDGVAVPLPDVSRVLNGHSTVFCDVAAKAVGRASEVRTLNVGGFPALQHIKGATGWMKLILKRAQTLHGRVTNSKGNPIEGAVVYTVRHALSSLPLDGYCSAKTDKNGEYEITDLKEWLRPKDAGEIKITSRQGNTVTGQVMPDHFIVHVWHPDYGQKWAECRACPGEFNVQMPEVGSVTGRAIDATTKAPLQGVLVHAEAQPNRRAGDFRATYSSNWAITDRNGNYRLALRAGNEYLVFSSFEGFIQNKNSPRINALHANDTATTDDIQLVRAGVVRAHLIDAASKQRIQFSSKPQVAVVLHGRTDSSTEDRDWPAEFAEGDTFLMRAAIPDWTYSVSVESKGGTISPRPSVTALNVRPGETVEIDLPVDVKKPGAARDKRP
ncbi:MAG TPA: carboxypeptidase regulatory-like domain-containing protein [Planctomycetaceae bacterium]|jgi:hypothetical protein|nr:carboxypeptidase regulatory-like domain-containing protein [Planctomycetaceae bacterium]